MNSEFKEVFEEIAMPNRAISNKTKSGIFQKSAAWYHRLGNRLKGKVTGKHYYYHGTSTDRAKKIMAEGIKPVGSTSSKGGTSSISEEALKSLGLDTKHHTKSKGHTFVTSDPSIAKEYAKQQDALEKVDNLSKKVKDVWSKNKEILPKGFTKKMEDFIRKASPYKSITTRFAATGLAKTPFTKGKIIRVEFPKEFAKKKGLANPEEDFVKSIRAGERKNVGIPPGSSIDKIIEKGDDLLNSFRHDKMFKGKIDKKYLK